MGPNPEAAALAVTVDVRPGPTLPSARREVAVAKEGPTKVGANGGRPAPVGQAVRVDVGAHTPRP